MNRGAPSLIDDEFIPVIVPPSGLKYGFWPANCSIVIGFGSGESFLQKPIACACALGRSNGAAFRECWLLCMTAAYVVTTSAASFTEPAFFRVVGLDVHIHATVELLAVGDKTVWPQWRRGGRQFQMQQDLFDDDRVCQEREMLEGYFARIRLFFGRCSSSHMPRASISGGT